MDEVWEYQRDYEVKAMIKDVAKNGGEYTFKTVKGKVQDVHHTTPEQLRKQIDV